MPSTFEKYMEKQLRKPKVREAYEDARTSYDLMRALIDQREASGLTQVEVARRMGVKQPTVSEFESGSSDPRLSTLQRYARAIGFRLILTLE